MDGGSRGTPIQWISLTIPSKLRYVHVTDPSEGRGYYLHVPWRRREAVWDFILDADDYRPSHESLGTQSAITAVLCEPIDIPCSPPGSRMPIGRSACLP